MFVLTGSDYFVPDIKEIIFKSACRSERIYCTIIFFITSHQFRIIFILFLRA